MIYNPSLVTIGSEIRVILRILPEQFERLLVVLVLLMRWICDVRRWDGLSGMIYTKQDYWYRHSSNIKVLSQKSESMQYWYYWHEGFIKYNVEMVPGTKFHKNWFGHSGNIQITTSAIWEATVLVLLTGGLYDVRRWNGLRWHDMHTKFHDNQFRQLSNIAVVTATVLEDIMLLLLIEGIYELCLWDGFMFHDIVPSFMKIGTVVQAILRFSFRNLKGCNVCITGGRDLRNAPLRRSQVHIKFYKDLLSNFEIY
jgi:hypothetical protein